MGLVLGAYQPNVQCHGSNPNWVFCRGILGDMPVLTMPQIFGPGDDPLVQVVLPHTLEAGSSNAVDCFGRTTLRTDVVCRQRRGKMCTATLWQRKSGCHFLVQDLGSRFRGIFGLYEA